MSDINTRTESQASAAIRLHEPCGASEVFCGNTNYTRDDSERFIRWLHLNGVTSARLGVVAYDMDGDVLGPPYRPLFISKAQESVYSTLRHASSFQPNARRGETPFATQWLIVIDGLLYSCMAEDRYDAAAQAEAFEPGREITAIVDARYVCPIRFKADPAMQSPPRHPRPGEAHAE